MVTIGCAYLSYFVANEPDASGVLATVTAGLVVALRAWPLVVKPEALEEVWVAIEHVGNTLIFSLAGVITRRASFGSNIRAHDSV